MRTTALVLSILVCLGAVCSQAHAQAWLPDRQYTEGPGIRVGNLELHPGIAVRGGWDSNVFRQKGGSEYPRLSSGLITITPHINLSTLGRQRMGQGEDTAGASSVKRKIAFDGGASATYFQYTKSEAQPAGANVGVDTDSRIRIMPDYQLGVDVSLGYQRTVQPFTIEPVNGNYARSVFSPGIRVHADSKSKVFTNYLGYAPTISYFEKAARDFDYLNSAIHNVQLGSAWKFLPHTALLFDGDLGFQRYFGGETDNPGNAVLLSDATSVQARVGLNGALTKKLSLRAFVGYAAMVFKNDLFSEYENAVGEAVLGYRFGQINQFDVGYAGNVTPSFVGGWMRTDRGFARLRTLIGGVFSLGAEAGAGYATYGRALRPGPTSDSAFALGVDNETERHDTRIDGAVRAEYRLTNWLALMADFITIANLTDFEYDRTNGTNSTVPLPAQFVTFQAYGGVRAHY